MSIEIKAVKKIKYCKHCGKEIDSETKKCTGCEKQYFYLSKRLATIVVLCGIITCLIGLNLYQYIDNKREIQKSNEKLESMTVSKDFYMLESDDASAELKKKEIVIAFWDKHFVICTPSGEKYHHYMCSHIAGAEYKIYTIEQAVASGYTPCLDCCKDK